MPKAIQNIDDVATEFSKWRKTKQPQATIPEDLWAMVSEIYNHYPTQRLCKELQLSTTQLKRKGFVVNPKSTAYEALPPSDTFIHVPPSGENEEQVESTSSIELHRPNGTRLVLHHPTASQVQHLLHTFIGD